MTRKDVDRPHCGTGLSYFGFNAGKDTTCQQCGQQFTLPPPAAAFARPPRPVGRIVTAAVCLIVAVGGLAYLWLDQQPDCPWGPPEPHTGEEAVLCSPDGWAVLMAVDKAASDRLSKLSEAHDDVGVSQLVRASKVLTVEQNARALVLSTGPLTHEVRILDGKHSGRSGYVARAWVHKQPPAADQHP